MGAMENKKECPRCGAREGQYRHTANRSGSERYRCSKCGKTYTPESNNFSEETKTLAIKMYYEGKSGRAIGRILGMSKANVVRWIKERVDALPPPDPHAAENTTEPLDVIELDEMFHFLKKKS
jgi:transposase-like protein